MDIPGVHGVTSTRPFVSGFSTPPVFEAEPLRGRNMLPCLGSPEKQNQPDVHTLHTLKVSYKDLAHTMTGTKSPDPCSAAGDQENC